MPTKPKIYFVPCYLPQVKYYARLIPYLKHAYDIGFLIVKKESVAQRQMIEYCEKNRFAFFVISDGLSDDGRMNFPFLAPIRKMRAHRKKCREFLEIIRPVKLIFEKTTNPHTAIAREARMAGVETIRLQTSFYGPWNASMFGGREEPSFLRRVYYQMLQLFYTVADMLSGVPLGALKRRAVVPDKLGAIDEVAAERILKEYDRAAPKMVSIVGTLDVEETHILKRRIESDAHARAELEKKYGIESGKINILVPSMRLQFFHLDGQPISEDYQIRYYERVFTAIRKVFSPEEANILFKLHPKEEDIYTSYTPLHVTVCGGVQASTDELMCLSELCVNNPWSSTNYYVLATSVPALFVNFSPIDGFNLAKDDYNIKEIVATEERFLELLEKFKEGILERQYDNNHIVLDSVKRIVELIG